MSQHDLTIANDTRTNVRTDIQSALQALGSTSKGNNAPATPYAGQHWIDDNSPSSSIWTEYVYDGTDWIVVGYIYTALNTYVLANAVPLTGTGGVGGSYYYTGQVLWGQNSTTVPGSGNTTTGVAISADGSAHFSNNGVYAVLINRNSDGNSLVVNRSGSNVGGISCNSSQTFFNTSSDYRLKFDVDDNVLEEAEQIVRDSRPIKHRWVRDPNGGLYWGFIAHEMQALMPGAVRGEKDAVDGDDIVPQQIDTGKLVPTLYAALKSALLKIDALEARDAQKDASIAALEARVATLEAPQS